MQVYVVVSHKENQSILITGESGAGKTENTKKVIQYFASVAGTVTGTKQSEFANLEEKVIQANPVLEAFGNARTIRNDNSSRFGKFIRIHFSNTGKIAGADIEYYLLEKSRVIQQQPGERSYHIFYQLLKCIGKTTLKQFLKSRDPLEYRILSKGIETVDSINDSREFESTLRRNEEQASFTQESFELADRVGHLLGIKSEDLKKSLLKPRIKVGNEWVYQGRSSEQVESSISALSMNLYDRMFKWIVDRVNQTLDTKCSKNYFIGVLDIAGFEIFAVNSFEQLCINYTNEKLQQFFNHHMFVMEQEEYRKENIEWTFIDFGLDLQSCIDLIEKPMGLLGLLDEECVFPKATDKSYVDKIISAQDGKSQNFSKCKFVAGGQRPHFEIAHYAGMDKETLLISGTELICKSEGILDSILQQVKSQNSRLLTDFLYITLELDVEYIINNYHTLGDAMIHSNNKTVKYFKEILFSLITSNDFAVLQKPEQISIVLKYISLPGRLIYRKHDAIRNVRIGKIVKLAGQIISISETTKFVDSTCYKCYSKKCKLSEDQIFRHFEVGFSESNIFRRETYCEFCRGMLIEDVSKRVMCQKRKLKVRLFAPETESQNEKEMIDIGENIFATDTTSSESSQLQPRKNSEVTKKISNMKSQSIHLINMIIRGKQEPKLELGQFYYFVGQPVYGRADYSSQFVNLPLSIEVNNLWKETIPSDKVNTQELPEELVQLKQACEYSEWSFVASLVYSFASEICDPTIYGSVKLATLLSIVGGHCELNNKQKGNIHILVISQECGLVARILSYGVGMCPRGGMTAGGVQSEIGAVFQKEGVASGDLIGGALPITNEGVCFIPLFDFLKKEDKEKIQKALETGLVPVKVAKGLSNEDKQIATPSIAQIPLTATIWICGDNISKLKVSKSILNQGNLQRYYSKAFTDHFTFAYHTADDDVIDEVQSELMLNQAIGADSERLIESNDLKIWLEIASGIETELSQDCIELLNTFYLASRRVRQSDIDSCQISVVSLDSLVPYTVKDWLVKNKDPVNESVVELFRKSNEQLICAMYEDFIAVSDVVGVSKQKKGSKFTTVAQTHKSSLAKLLDNLYNTQPHFVRCIIPNEIKRPGIIDAQLILHQLSCNGVLEGIRICRRGFPNRMPFEDFRHRYAILTPQAIPDGFMDGRCISELIITALELDKNEYRIGNSKVFFKAGVIGRLEDLRDQKLSKVILSLQARCRGWLMRKHYQKMQSQKLAVIVLQKNCKTHLILRNWAWWRLFTKVKPILKVSRTEEDLKKRDDQISNLRDRLKTLEAEMGELQERNISSMESNQDILNEMRKEQELVAELEDRNEKLEIKRREMQEEILELESRLDEEEDANVIISTAKRKLDVELDKSRIRIEELQEEIHNLDEEKRLKEQDFNQLGGEFEQLTEQLSKLQKDKKNQEDLFNDTNASLQSQEDKNNQLIRSKQKFETLLLEVQEQLANEKSSRSEIEKSKRKLEQDMRALQQDLENLTNEILESKALQQKKENELTNVINNHDESQNENSNLQKKIKKLELIIEELEEDIEQERENLRKVEKVKSDLNRDLEDLEDKLERQGGITTVQVDLNRKREQDFKTLQKELEVTRAEHSKVLGDMKRSNATQSQNYDLSIEQLKKGKIK
ncbi:Myosin heavy chain, striated muscle-like [Oopsacas minuta]|uniref:Myosin heavy chain, striated muscle-like n=1 Tax=Oopsacas minuta TaxID=111878 RepID=A0AAV7KDB9_9METZ|nr:Myosin heavy chain, striated muscle-like [Oopsacas minuta]